MKQEFTMKNMGGAWHLLQNGRTVARVHRTPSDLGKHDLAKEYAKDLLMDLRERGLEALEVLA